MLATRERWRALCQRIGARDNPITGRTVDGTYNELVAAYTGPDRYYHNLNHISDGLALIDEVLHLAKDPDALEMAWWWHDYIYDAISSTNEDDSAQMANKALTDLLIYNFGLGRYFRSRVTQLIKSTKHDHVPDTNDATNDRCLIIDIDLALLAAQPEVFDQNTAKIRNEYGVISDEDFRVGRARFFRNFLANRPSIYLTDYFRDKYEAKAQKNVQRLIAKADI